MDFFNMSNYNDSPLYDFTHNLEDIENEIYVETESDELNKSFKASNCVIPSSSEQTGIHITTQQTQPKPASDMENPIPATDLRETFMQSNDQAIRSENEESNLWNNNFSFSQTSEDSNTENGLSQTRLDSVSEIESPIATIQPKAPDTEIPDRLNQSSDPRVIIPTKIDKKQKIKSLFFDFCNKYSSLFALESGTTRQKNKNLYFKIFLRRKDYLYKTVIRSFLNHTKKLFGNICQRNVNKLNYLNPASKTKKQLFQDSRMIILDNYYIKIISKNFGKKYTFGKISELLSYPQIEELYELYIEFLFADKGNSEITRISNILKLKEEVRLNEELQQLTVEYLKGAFYLL